MKTRNARYTFVTLVLGLGLTLVLLWLLNGGVPNAAHAQGPDGDSVYYVAPGGNCGGMSPCFGNVQDAVDAVDDPDDVVKVTGTYAGVNDRGEGIQAVYISKTVTVRGGYMTTNWVTSDPEANPTTLNAMELGRVLYLTGGISVTIDGLRITGGHAAGDYYYGGLYLDNVTATLTRNTISNNRHTGLYAKDSSITLSKNVISFNQRGGVDLDFTVAVLNENTIFSNTASYWGGGLNVDGGVVTLTNNTILSNTAGQDGGGLSFDYNATATLIGNTVMYNTAQRWGGGLFLYGSATLSGNTVMSNTTNDGGGGLYLGGHAVTLSGNTVMSNTATDRGGGLFLDSIDATLASNVVADNQANGAGSGLYISNSSLRLLHNTIACNTGGDGTGLYVTSSSWRYSTIALTNTILVSHTMGITVAAGSTATLEATLWGSGAWANETDWGGAGTIVTGAINIKDDPVFVAPDSGNYHISLGSAAQDAGVDVDVQTDIDGESRPFGVKPDLGADELAVTLSVGKVGPVAALTGDPITYTLTITNSGAISASGIVITDALPNGAHYISGGTLMPGGVVSWTVSSLAANDDVQMQFVVTATQTIINSDYHVSCVEGVSATGSKPVVTVVTDIGYNIYLPLILRQFP